MRSNLNILQLAVLNKQTELARYILKENMVLTSTRQLKPTLSRVILLNNDDENDETLTLRLAAQTDNTDLFIFLLNEFTNLYNDSHLLAIGRYLIQT